MMFLGAIRRGVLSVAVGAALALPSHGEQTTMRGAPAEATTKPAQASEVGIATVYSARLEGQPTASGEPYSGEGLTAAHRVHPLGTTLRITGVRSGNTVTVRVNDRWSGGAGRVVNLSSRAARELGFGSSGTLEVRIEVDRLGTELRTQREAPTTRLSFDVPTGDSPAGTSRSRHCAREAKILGLQDDWADRHVRSCLAFRPRR